MSFVIKIKLNLFVFFLPFYFFIFFYFTLTHNFYMLHNCPKQPQRNRLNPTALSPPALNNESLFFSLLIHMARTFGRHTRVHKLNDKKKGITIWHWFIYAVHINVGQRHWKKSVHRSLWCTVFVSYFFLLATYFIKITALFFFFVYFAWCCSVFVVDFIISFGQ